ncbi:Vitamin B12 import ATP-binding protein BtuD [Pseudomonas fluorescens]|nr:Vitamin B12 import ATP-binding protein BtuD [Pseudomonas fluorescens]
MTHVNRLPALVSLQHLCFQFANGETLLEDLTLSIDPAPTGIVGRNGCGKSILARLIAGELSPSCGTLDRRASVAFVPQAVVVEPGDTVASLTGTADTLAALDRMARGTASVDDLATINERWDLADRLRSALDAARLSQLSADTPAGQLSGGQLARVAIIGALQSAPQLLVLDEPTNHLDSAGRTWLLRVLADRPGGLVVVSHDRQLLSRMERIIELSPLGVRVYGGNYDAYRVQREAQQQASVAALEHARLERSRERLKAAMAIALWRHVPAQLLLLDEPRNHLDLESVAAFEQALQGFGGAMVVVSHDAAFVQAFRPTHRLRWTPDGWRLDAA